MKKRRIKMKTIKMTYSVESPNTVENRRKSKLPLANIKRYISQ